MATVNIQKIIQNIAGRLKEFQLTGEDTSAGAGDAVIQCQLMDLLEK